MQLLVSIKNLEEAAAAAAGSPDIIDIKNPEEGSLGANFPPVINEIVEKFGNDFPMSAAIGDMPDLPGTAALAAHGLAGCGLDYIKLGLYGISQETEAVYMLKKVKQAAIAVNPTVAIIGVGYADYARFGGFPVEKLPAVGDRADITGVMIDTKDKADKNLFDFLSLPQLQNFIKEARQRYLTAALAGSLQQSDLDILSSLNPDIIGVRSAVCQNFERRGSLSSELVKQLQKKTSEKVG